MVEAYADDSTSLPRLLILSCTSRCHCGFLFCVNNVFYSSRLPARGIKLSIGTFSFFCRPRADPESVSLDDQLLTTITNQDRNPVPSQAILLGGSSNPSYCTPVRLSVPDYPIGRPWVRVPGTKLIGLTFRQRETAPRGRRDASLGPAVWDSLC